MQLTRTGNTQPPLYGTVVLSADDIGIAALLLYAKQLVQSTLANQCVTTKVVPIWRYSHEGTDMSPCRKG